MRLLATTVLLLAGAAAAQEDQGDVRRKLEKQMEEISRLMRDSERHLLELTRVDRVAAQQAEIVDKLKKLIEEPPPSDATGAANREQQKQELERQQGEIQRRFQELLEAQKRLGELSAEELRRLLRDLPRQQSQSPQGGEDKDKKDPKDKDREQQKSPKEQEQRKESQRPRDKEQHERKPEDSSEDKKKDETEDGRRLKRIEAWIAQLPPEEQARINRNDFSHIPARYRRLVQEYTALRAQREAERRDEDR